MQGKIERLFAFKLSSVLRPHDLLFFSSLMKAAACCKAGVMHKTVRRIGYV